MNTWVYSRTRLWAPKKKSAKKTLDVLLHLTLLWLHSSPLLPTPYHCRHPRVNFVGQYEHQMDDKGRVSLPSAFRREADGDRFVLLQWEKPYLTLFPLAKWEEVQQRLLEFRKIDKDGWNRVRVIVSNAVEVSPDKQGRILVPSGLQAAASLEGSVLLAGNIDRVELWDPETYAEVVQAGADDLEQFSHQLFG